MIAIPLDTDVVDDYIACLTVLYPPDAVHAATTAFAAVINFAMQHPDIGSVAAFKVGSKNTFVEWHPKKKQILIYPEGDKTEVPPWA